MFFDPPRDGGSVKDATATEGTSKRPSRHRSIQTHLVHVNVRSATLRSSRRIRCHVRVPRRWRVDQYYSKQPRLLVPPPAPDTRPNRFTDAVCGHGTRILGP